MVGVTYLNCDLRSLIAKAAKLVKRVRDLIDDLHIQRRRQPRGCRAGRLARRDAKPKMRQLGIPRRDSGENPPLGTYLYARSAMVHTSSAATASRRTVALLATEH